MSCSNGSILQFLVNIIMPENVHTSCCNFTGSDVLHIRILAKFYFDLSATFLNFQYSSMSSYLVNVMTPQNLPALCCNFTWMFFTWNSWNTSIFFNFQTTTRSGCMLNMKLLRNCMYQVITLQGGCWHLNLLSG